MTGEKTVGPSAITGFEEAAGWPNFALALLDASSDGVTLIDLSGKILAMNPAALRLLQIENPGDVAGRPWESLWDEKDRLLARDGVEAARTGEAAKFNGRRTDADGETRAIRVVAEPVRDESGLVRCVLACARGVADGSPQEERLEAFDRRVGDFVHDFNNVFAAVRSAARMLRRRVTDAPALEIVSHLEGAVERGCALSGQLLEFARADETSCDAPSPRPILAGEARINSEPPIEEPEMRLIGMLDSPFVRRVAVALLTAEVPFVHEPISLFRHIDAFQALSPQLKAPSLIEDDGTALVESGVILDYLETKYPAMAALRPRRLPTFHALGLALNVMEKAVQLHYERNLRGPGERSESWTARVRAQFDTGLAGLEATIPELWFEDAPGHADIAVVCAFGFVRGVLVETIDFALYPRLAAFSARGETLGPFLAAPPLDGVKIGPRKALA